MILPSLSLNQAVLAPPPVATLFLVLSPGTSYSSNTTPRALSWATSRSTSATCQNAWLARDVPARRVGADARASGRDSDGAAAGSGLSVLRALDGRAARAARGGPVPSVSGGSQSEAHRHVPARQASIPARAADRTGRRAHSRDQR